MDWLIRKAKISIINLLNGINLPMEVKRLLLVEILDEVTKKTEEMIKEQLEAEKQSESNESEVSENGN